MDLAEDHIRNAGYGGFSFRDLAAEIGIKSASVHHHFPTKATMAAAVARRYGDRFLASVARRLNETADNAIRAYRAAFREGLQRDGRMCLNGDEPSATQRPQRPRQIRENEMARNSRLDDEAATELHNRLANQIVAQIVNEPIAAGGTISDGMMLCESVLAGVVLGCFEVGSDAKVLDLVIGRVKERLAKARLEDLEPKGNG